MGVPVVMKLFEKDFRKEEVMTLVSAAIDMWYNGPTL